ncbi:MAG: hypothetical protein KME14_07455 [Tildeniella torsiva UHER 1998/13D]|jgi:hypothetical protein|nr:hypothetical protein [Tildeniella torsiva UHER 1998/13D]
MMKRKPWPKQVADKILTECHHRCCICPEHRRVANIHHIDGDHSRSIEENAVGLCGECHLDVHSSSTMRRNITQNQIRAYKQEWIGKCSNLDISLRENANKYRSIYYLNVHRLEALYKNCFSFSFLSGTPHEYPSQAGAYNTLWPNHKNSLDWIKLAENRSFFEECLFAVVDGLKMYDINLFEVGAISPKEKVGQLVSYSCQFIGQDIPYQKDLVEHGGQILGPSPTMRRQVKNESSECIIETCMVLDSNYMYSDSSFIHFSEHGIWNGFGKLIKCRNVGSNDWNLEQQQIVISPICIGIPPDITCTTQIGADAFDADQQYQKLISQLL